MPEVAAALGNVYFDTAASPFLYRPEVFAAVASLVGADCILMGSDFPLLRARRLLKQAADSPLPQGQRDAISGANASRLLGLLPSP